MLTSTHTHTYTCNNERPDRASRILSVPPAAEHLPRTHTRGKIHTIYEERNRERVCARADTYTPAHTHTRTHTHMRTHTDTQRNTQAHARTRAHAHAHTNTQRHTCARVHTTHMRTRTRAHTHTHRQTHTHHFCARTHTHRHPRTHTHTHIDTDKHVRKPKSWTPSSIIPSTMPMGLSRCPHPDEKGQGREKNNTEQ